VKGAPEDPTGPTQLVPLVSPNTVPDAYHNDDAKNNNTKLMILDMTNPSCP
jgi:hypothetical protein